MTTESKTDIKTAYQAKGAQASSYKEYLAKQEKAAQKSKSKVPAFVKYIFMAPFFIIFIFGVFFLPYMLFKAFTSPSSDSKDGKIASSTISQKTSSGKSN